MRRNPVALICQYRDAEGEGLRFRVKFTISLSKKRLSMFSRSQPLVQPAQPFQPIEKIVVTVLVLFSIMLFAIIYMMDISVTHKLTSESGFFEVMSPPLWIALAVLCVVKLGFRKWGLGTAALALIFAAREADLHKAFTAQSIFKHHFYKMEGVPFAQKFWGGLVAVICIGIMLWMLFSFLSYLYRTKGWRQAWGRLTILSIALVIFTKICDRLEATLNVDYHIFLSEVQGEICNMHEEGFEMLLPFMFAISLLVWCRRVRSD